MATKAQRIAWLAILPPAPERDRASGTDPRPRYEPPRIQKKRSLSRATLFTGQGPEGPSTAGPGLVGDG